MRTILAIIIVVALILLGVSFFGARTEAPGTEVPEESNGDTAEESEETVEVFFYSEAEDTDETGNIVCSADAVLAVERQVDREALEADPVRTVLGELLEGPTAEEMEEGFSSEFPAEGFEVENVSTEEGTATVTFADPENFTTGGSCRVTLLYAQVEKTVEALEEVESVVILPETLFQP